MAPPPPLENLIPLDASPEDRRDDRSFWINVLVVTILAVLPAVALRQLLFLFAPIAGTTVHVAYAIAETLYVAGALSIFGIAWLAPTGAPRLRSTLISCLALAAGLLAMFQLAAPPGVNGGGAGSDGAWLLGRLAHLTLPLMLMTLVLAPRRRSLSKYLRWGFLTGTLAWVLPVAAAALALAPAAHQWAADTDSAFPYVIAQWLLTGTNILAAIVVLRVDVGSATDWRIVAAAALGAVSAACLIPEPDGSTACAVLSSAYAVVAQAVVLLGVYADAVGQPYRELDQSRAEALLRKESLGAVIHSVAEGVVVIDRRLRVVAMNPVARNLAGAGSDPDGRPLEEVLASIETSGGGGLVAAAKDCLARNQVLPATECWSVDGRSDVACVIEHSTSPICDRDGRARGAVLVLRDVTERWRLHRQLAETAEYARNLIEASADAMMVIGQDGRIADVNRAAEQATDLARRQLIGLSFADCFSDPASVRQALERVFPDGIVRDLPLTLSGNDGTVTEVSCNITPYRNADGRVCGAFAVARDITDMRLVQKQLQFQARHDSLTGLPNRRHLRERLDQALARSRSHGGMVAVFLLDLDDFRDVNDTLGHSSGDQLIKCIGSRLAQGLRSTDTVARIGGDEFAILVEGITQADEICPIANKLLEVTTAPVPLEVSDVTVSCSIGVSVFPIDPGDADTLLRNADTALYRAKEAGKNSFRSFTAEMNDAVQRRVDLGNRLRGALGRNEFTLHYQPVVDLAAGHCRGVEALIRWTPEGCAPVAPADFIPIAENSGLILDIGVWVLEQACRQAVQWRQSNGADVSVAVNLSARQLRDDDIVAVVARVLADTGLPPHLLVLELTESMLMRDPQRAAQTMAMLKETGVRIALDDFGTGYSSLSYLKRFPLDYLKIDRSFVTDIPGDANDETIVRSIVALAHSLGLKVIGEGVETAAQMSFLRHLGCSEVQGYFFSRPVPAAQLPALLAQLTDLAVGV